MRSAGDGASADAAATTLNVLWARATARAAHAKVALLAGPAWTTCPALAFLMPLGGGGRAAALTTLLFHIATAPPGAVGVALGADGAALLPSLPPPAIWPAVIEAILAEAAAVVAESAPPVSAMTTAAVTAGAAMAAAAVDLVRAVLPPIPGGKTAHLAAFLALALGVEPTALVSMPAPEAALITGCLRAPGSVMRPALESLARILTALPWAIEGLEPPPLPRCA